MKKYILLSMIVLSGLSLQSCNSWLDVTPPSQIREEDQFKTVEGFQQALIGCYLGMTDDQLYGRTLSWSTIELMGGQFVALQPSTSNDYYISVYNYNSSNAIKHINGIWTKSYNVIANVNNALKFIEINKGILDGINYNLIKGELLAIRAFIHFDLMRLYGYGNLSVRTDINTKSAIPYVSGLSKEMTSQVSYQQTLNLIIKDLNDALTLLEIDPVTKIHPASYYNEVNIDGFYNSRQQRFNYYAVTLLLSRVYLWEGSSQSITLAQQLASKVIAEAETKGLVSWANSTSVTDDIIMKSEHLMSLNIQNLVTKSSDYFKTQIVAASDIKAQYISADNLTTIYEAETIGNTDFRFSKQFIQNTNVINGKNSYTPMKYFGTPSAQITKNYVPLLRLPEAYYIAAECKLKTNPQDVTGALTLLNSVRAKRGITTEITSSDPQVVMSEIIKEYRKEYYCEGMMFYLYKRLGIETIPGYNLSANDAIYLLPYPSVELQMGRKQ